NHGAFTKIQNLKRLTHAKLMWQQEEIADGLELVRKTVEQENAVGPHVEGGVYCFHKKRRCNGYQVTGAAFDSNKIHLAVSLLDSSGCGHYGADIRNLKVTISFETDAQLHIKLADEDHDRYEIPNRFVPTGEQFEEWQSANSIANSKFKFSYRTNPFTFSVQRKDNNETIFDTNVAGMDALVYEQQYLEISTVIPMHSRIYGLGEVVHRTLERDKRNTWQTLWARDAASPVDENVYGSHPFYVGLQDGLAHGVFLRNSNGMDIVMSGGKLVYKGTRLLIETKQQSLEAFWIFTSLVTGPTPDDVIDQYTAMVGRPAMPPKWALGFHHSRYGFESIDAVRKVVEKYREHAIPLDTIWLDIDYMDKQKDFTYDPEKFPVSKVNELVKDLHEQNQKIVAIIDPGIKVERGYPAYETGIQRDVFIKNKNGRYAVGKVWPGYTVFPDFHSDETQHWWKNTIEAWLKQVPLDGLWIDMNEVASWCKGECSKSELKDVLKLLPPSSPNRPGSAAGTYDNVQDPFYRIRNFGNSREPLDVNTMAVDAIHSDGMLEYDVHNMYGHIEAIATRKAMLEIRPNERPFILTRSTFSGSGAHAAHWLGDNWSTWESLLHSVSGTMSFQLFGIPLVGPDICGFNGNTDEELCLRWMQLGAFYPFARNHNAIGYIDQEPYLWESVRNASRAALSIRYTLLPYLYTQFQASSQSGRPVWRPLFFDFPNDQIAVRIDRQFLVGNAILVSPVLDPQTIFVHGYFPAGRWYDWYTHEKVVDSDKGLYMKLEAPLNKIPVHVRGGSVVPTQAPYTTVHETSQGPMSVLIALDESNLAKGVIYHDDGKSIDVSNSYTMAHMVAKETSLTITGIFGYPHILDKITVLGTSKCNSAATSVLINGRPKYGVQSAFDNPKGALTISGLDVLLSKNTSITWHC
ncbi:hypothetical protein INT44_008145, partial [Umbelopsis vinacea]